MASTSLHRTNSLQLPNTSIEESLRLSGSSSKSFQSSSSNNINTRLTSTSQNNNISSSIKEMNNSDMRPNNLVDTSNNSNNNSTRVSKKRRNGKGRMMMVKVFYSLSSPRQPEASTSALPSPAPVQTPTNNDSPYASTSAFLAVLDPSLAPSPTTSFTVNSPIPLPTPEAQTPLHQYTCIARLSAPIWVQLLGGNNSQEGVSTSDVIEYGKLTLKTCLSAICISRPELVADPTKDYAVSAVDPYESSLNPTSTFIETGINSGRTGQGLMEGKGMLSWNLAEKREGTTFVCGRVIGDGGVAANRAAKRRKLEESNAYAEGEGDESEEEEGTSETLEVWLQLVERPSFTQNQFLTSLRSFANPSQANSDRASPPPTRQSNTSNHNQSNGQQSHSNSGDPVKRKRSRTITEQPQQQQSQSHPTRSQQQPQKSRRSAVVSLDTPIASTSTTLVPPMEEPFDVASLQNPEVLGLLSQLFPNLANSSDSNPSTATSTLPNFSIDSPQGQALLPAIRTLAKFYGVSIPGVPTPDLQVESLPIQQEDLQVFAPIVPSASSLRQTANLNQSINVNSSANTNTNTDSKKGKGKASAETGAFEIVTQDESEKSAKGGGSYNPIDIPGGCSNCPRKKSATWRMRREENGTRKVMVCNPCGVYYNKHGHHRTKGDRNTSPPAPNRSLEQNQLPSSSRLSKSADQNNISVGRPLQGQLTASCESDLLRKSSSRKHKRSSTSSNNRSLIAPPSPSKLIGPNRASPKSIFRHGGLNHHKSLQNNNGISQFMTSPLRSPRNRAMRNYNMSGVSSLGGGMGSTSFSNMLLGLAGSATSPLRNSSGNIGTGVGLRSGYASGGIDLGGVGGAGGESFDFSTLYSGQQSPSPIKPNSGLGAVPEYLLTASPGTALKRILSDTNIDMNSFNMLDGGVGVGTRDGDLGSDAFDGGLDFYLRSTPEEEKENNPLASQNFNFDLTSGISEGNDYLPPPTTTDGPSTDFFDSVLSTLGRDFDTRLPSTSNALTSPSSPVPSSPCVQPRTSSATPGQKSKAPMSSGRAPPSILDSFIDGLVPAFALNHRNEDGDTPTESEGWTPLSGNGEHDGLDLESILAGGNHLQSTSINNETYNLSHLLRSSRSNGRSYLPSHLLAGGMTSDSSTAMDHQRIQTQHQQFDFGSLPPSSPPALPSELQLATPSDFDGITPDGRDDDMMGMANLLGRAVGGGGGVVYRVPSERLEDFSLPSLTLDQQVSTSNVLGTGVSGEVAKQEAITALLASFGLPCKGELESQLLEMLQNKGGIVDNQVAESLKKVVEEQKDDHEEIKNLYDSLF